MRIVILSDIHLGNEGGYDIFAGAEALPKLLDSLAVEPTRVILNGDTVDFLMNQDPLSLDTARAVAQAKAIVEAPGSRAVFEALGRVLAADGAVVVRLGNHDAELALAEVQAVFREALGQPAKIAAGMTFERGDQPAVIGVGGAKILVAHGEHNDPWNRLDYANLPGPDAPVTARAARFRYPPGSELVKTILNPLKVEHGMRFADLLKPDFQGAVLTAMAVNPGAFKAVFSGSTVKLMWHLFRQSRGPMTFDEEAEELGLAEAIEAAGLTSEELEALEFAVDPDAPADFGGDDDGLLDRARIKLGRAGLKAYAATQRALAGRKGEAYFQLEPGPKEWKDAERLTQKYGVDAVVVGHSHSARFRQTADACLVNTGTWIWLMQLPDPDANADEWAAFLQLCRDNPQLDPKRGPHAPLVTRFTGCLVTEAEGGGADIALIEYRDDAIHTLAEGRVGA